MHDLDEDEFTELVGADFPRVDLVHRPANGAAGWLVMKEADGAGLLDPDYVRDLIAKTGHDQSGREQVTVPSGIRISGSAADIVAFIHQASQRADADGVAKAEMSGKSQNDLPDSAFAFIESGGKKDSGGKTTPRSKRHFPIHDAAHVRNALARASQSPFGDKAMPKIRAAAKRFGIEVGKEGGVAAVTKDMGPELDEGIDGLDPTVPLAAPPEDCDAPGDPADPGSPAWEAIDAATAQKWCCIASRLKNALCLLAERETLEAASADPDDAENAWDLQDAECAMDYVIGQLAVFAAGEQAEAQLGAEAMEAIGKAMTGFDPAPLEVIEGLTAVRKSGRVLSSANESRIRDAAQQLQAVLSSLPKAPVTDDGQQVAKEKGTPVPETATATRPDTAQVEKAATPEEQARDTGPVNAGGTTGLGQPRETGPAEALPGDGPQQARPGDVPGRTVIKAEAAAVGVFDRARRFLGLADSAAILTDIAKADGAKKPMCVVYNQAGKLMGIVDPDDITPVANSEAEPEDDMSDGDTSAEAQPDPSDMTPQPPADAGTPADAVADDGTVTKQDSSTDGTRDVLKSIVRDALAELLGEQAPAKDVAKAADVARLLEQVEAVKARLATVEEQPAVPKVFTNGAVPPAHQMRGQDHGAALQVDIAKAAEMKRQMYTADPADANRIANEMQQRAIDHLAALHAAG